MATSLGCYVFGVTTPGVALPSGLDAMPLAERVVTLAAGGIRALVSPVAVDEFTEDGTDPAWFVPRAVAHDRVLITVAAVQAVVPFRFGAVHHSEAAAGCALEGASARLASALRRLGTRREWMISVSTAAVADAPAIVPAGTGRGRAYLAARGAELAVEDRRDAAVAEITRRCAGSGIATCGLSMRPDGTRRLACLVPRAAERLVLSRLDRLRAETVGARIVVAGPLPPYHFVDDALR